jgi:hypothetical protein
MSILDENAAQNITGLGVTNEMKRSWMSTSKWALFFAIIGFIYIGLSALMLGSMGAIFQSMSMLMGDSNPAFAMFGPMMSYITIIAGLMLVVMFFINFYHLRFANQIQRAVNVSDQNAFEKAWMNLRNHFRLYGIATCVVLALYLIMFIVIGTMAANSTLPADNF